MAKPTTKVEIAFNVGFTGTPTWVDYTSRVRHDPGIDIEHWSSDEDDETQPSTLTLVLRNDDGRFTPGNTSSLHYPNVKRNRPIRVTSTLAGVTYTRFTGYVDDWSVTWPATVGTISDCVITATSRSSRLGRGVELRSIVEEEILLDSPLVYYTLGEPSGSTRASDTSGNNGPAAVRVGTGPNVVFGDATGPGTDGLTGATFADGKFLRAQGVDADGNSPDCLEFCISTTSSTAATIFTSHEDNDPYVNVFSVQLTAAGKIKFARDNFSGSFTSTSSATINDGLVHHVVIEEEGTNTNLYIDGVLDSTPSPAVWGLKNVLNIGGYKFSPPGPGETYSGPSTLFTGSLEHVAVYASAMGATRVAAHYRAVSDGFEGETPAARLTRYASYIGLTAVSFETGHAPMGHIDVAGMTALEAMRRVEFTEDGVLFDALDGTLTFHDRAHRYTAPNAFTVSYTAKEISAPLSPVLDDQRQKNDLTVTNSNAVKVLYPDATSIAANGYYRDDLQLDTVDDDEPLQRAAWVVGRYADPPQRISELEVLLNKSGDTLTAGVLGAQPGTKFTATNLPANAPSSTMVLFVEGRRDHITNDEDRVTLLTSPGELYAVLTLDSAALGLDSAPLAY